MAGIAKPQEKFLMTLFSTILVLRGRVNFLNLSRYCGYSDRTIGRQFRQSFDWTQFNRQCLKSVVTAATNLIVAGDASFIRKSGRHTYGLDNFFNGCHARAERGLEISLLSLIDVDTNTAYALSVKQTKSPLPSAADKSNTSKAHKDETRMDDYLQHLEQTMGHIPAQVRYAVFDGYHAKRKFVDGVCQTRGLHMISKLRGDANLRYLYTGPQQNKRGRPKRYDGKVDFNDLSRFDDQGKVDEHIHLYTAVLNHPRLGRDMRVVVVLSQKTHRPRLLAVLFSTDTQLSATAIYRYYKARFQIEFLFRDAKQHTGLEHCQARDSQALDFHFNASFATLNLAKLDAVDANRNRQPTAAEMVFSLSSIKQRYFNEHLMDLLISNLDIEPSVIKLHPQYHYLRDYGAIAA